MSRRRKRIAAATVLTVAVLGLGFAGYIQATRASGRDTIISHVDGTDFHRYRLNHQVGSDRADAYLWLGENQFASSFEEAPLQSAHTELAGSNEPEDSDESDVAKTGTANANAAGDAGPGSNDINYPAAAAGGPSTANAGGGDAGWGLSSIRLAGSFANYRGGSGGGGNGPQGSDNPPGSQPNGNTPPADEPEDKPTGTAPSDGGGPGATNPDPNGPTNPTPPDTNHPPQDDPNGNPQGPPAAAVPEPATFGLLGFGFAAMGFMRRRRGSAA